MKTITLNEYKVKLGYKATDSIIEIQDNECLWDYPIEELEYCKFNNINVVPIKNEEGELRLYEY